VDVDAESIPFDAYVAARLPALLRYGTLLCGDPDDARDLVQEVLTKALVRWSRIGATRHVDAYVRAMLTNEFISDRRRRKRRPQAPLPDPPDGPGTPAVPGPDPDTGARGDLWARLLRLPPKQRAVVVLRYYEDLSDAQIAALLGCREGTVRTYASRALAALRIDLAPAGGGTHLSPQGERS
jgi:RNA polymerase sigma-70 factor (sigma-E family)